MLNEAEREPQRPESSTLMTTDTKQKTTSKKAVANGPAMRVLAVCGDPDALSLICSALEEANYEVSVATDAQRALTLALQQKPGIFLLGPQTNREDGLPLTRWLRAGEQEDFIPVVFISPSAEEAMHLARDLEIEPAGTVLLPLNPAELVTQIHHAARLKVAEQKARDQITIDETTGLFNRRFFLRRFEEELGRARRHQIPLACARIGIDHFTSLELTHGKEFAEYLITTIATLVKANTRREDTLARFDERELAALLTNYNAESSWVYGERIRKSVEAHTFEVHGKPLKVTLSVGIACYTSDQPGAGVQELLQRSSDALQQAQNIGRNDIVVSVNLDSGESILCW